MSKKVTPPAEPTAEAVVEEKKVQVFRSVDQVVADLIKALPQLASHRDELTRVAQVFVQFVEPPTGAPAPAKLALKHMESFMGATPDMIAVDAEELAGVIADVLGDLVGQFNTETQSDLTLEDMNFTHRHNAELAEQAELVRQARDLIEKVREVSSGLGITNPDPALKTPEKPKKEKFGDKLRKVAQSAANAGTMVARKTGVGLLVNLPDEEMPEVDAPPPSWQTAPVINITDDDFEMFGTVYSTVSELPDPAQAKSYLQNFGLNDSKLEELMTRVIVAAREQEAQSEEIVEVVSGRSAVYASAINQVEEVRSVVASTYEYVLSL